MNNPTQAAPTVTPVSSLSIQVKRMNMYDNKKTKAFVDILINGVLTIRGFKVVEGKDGLFVSNPSHFDAKSNKWYNDVTFENAEYLALQQVVVAHYEQQILAV